MKDKKSRYILASLSAGFINGLLGTGGGVPLYYAISRREDEKTAYATASVSIMLLSLQTVFLYRNTETPITALSPFLPVLAIGGGALGALLLGRVKTRFLRGLFAFLLILSGGYLLGKEIYLAFYQ